MVLKKKATSEDDVCVFFPFPDGHIMTGSPLAGFSENQDEMMTQLRELYPAVYPNHLTNNAIRHRIPNPEQKSRETVIHLVSAVAFLERWLWKKYNETVAIEAMEPSKLDAYLAEYFLIVRKQNGDDYDPTSLVKLRSYIARYLREHNSSNCMNVSPLFSSSRAALARRRKMLGDKRNVSTSL